MIRDFADWDEQLTCRVDEVLYYIWDPIGVANAPEARDEYYGYVAPVVSLLKADANAQQIASHLEGEAKTRMGTSPPPGTALLVADILVRWRKHIERYS